VGMQLMGFDQIAAKHSEEAWIAKYRAALAHTPTEKSSHGRVRRLISSIYSGVAARLVEIKKGKSQAAKETTIAMIKPVQTRRGSPGRQRLPQSTRKKLPVGAVSGRTRTRLSGVTKK
jgi:hypothetical protein